MKDNFIRRKTRKRSSLDGESAWMRSPREETSDIWNRPISAFAVRLHLCSLSELLWPLLFLLEAKCAKGLYSSPCFPRYCLQNVMDTLCDSCNRNVHTFLLASMLFEKTSCTLYVIPVTETRIPSCWLLCCLKKTSRTLYVIPGTETRIPSCFPRCCLQNVMDKICDFWHTRVHTFLLASRLSTMLSTMLLPGTKSRWCTHSVSPRPASSFGISWPRTHHRSRL